jgi:peptidyl-tRNA hydrolase, PTH1 family
MKLIFAQGNPEPDFSGQRHNVGFQIVNAFASKHQAIWRSKSKLHAVIAEVLIAGEKTILAKPTTFYNETGVSLRKIIDFFKLDPSQDILIIHDDLALDFGTIKIRGKGSDAGNNGIKSINQHVSDYWRIRIGIKNDLIGTINDSDFVLARFSKTEESALKKQIIPSTLEIIDQFIAVSNLAPDSRNLIK